MTVSTPPIRRVTCVPTGWYPWAQSPTRRTYVSFQTASGTGAPGPRVEGAGSALVVRRPSSPPSRLGVSRSLCRSSFRLHRMHKARTSSSSGSGDGCLKPCRRQTEFSTGCPWAPPSAGQEWVLREEWGVGVGAAFLTF